MSATPPFGSSAVLRCGRGRRGGVVSLPILMVLTSACATKGDIRGLQETVQAEAQEQEQGFRHIAAEIQALRDSVEGQAGRVADTSGGIARELRDLQDQLSRLMALTGEIQREVAFLSTRIDAQQAGVARTPRGGDADSLYVLTPDVAGADPAAAQDTYEAAMAQLSRGSLATAERAFETFLVDYPDHRLAPSAQFFLGDVFEQQGRLDEATEAFLRIPQLYPADDRVPQALYRTGAIYALQENLEEAARYLETVVNTYPDSGAADLAGELLQEIR